MRGFCECKKYLKVEAFKIQKQLCLPQKIVRTTGIERRLPRGVQWRCYSHSTLSRAKSRRAHLPIATQTKFTCTIIITTCILILIRRKHLRHLNPATENKKKTSKQIYISSWQIKIIFKICTHRDLNSVSFKWEPCWIHFRKGLTSD